MSGSIASPQYWSPCAVPDNLVRFFDLSSWFQNGDAPSGTPTASVGGISGDVAPMVISSGPVWDLGQKTVYVRSGMPYVSPGPRLMFALSGGSAGHTYEVQATFRDTLGQTKAVTGFQFVQWDSVPPQPQVPVPDPGSLATFFHVVNGLLTLNLSAIPTDPTGLPSGAVWLNGGVFCYVP
jgi:hypothetical protein